MRERSCSDTETTGSTLKAAMRSLAESAAVEIDGPAWRAEIRITSI